MGGPRVHGDRVTVEERTPQASSLQPRRLSCAPATLHAADRATSSVHATGPPARALASDASPNLLTPPALRRRDSKGRHTTCTHGACLHAGPADCTSDMMCSQTLRYLLKISVPGTG